MGMATALLTAHHGKIKSRRPCGESKLNQPLLKSFSKSIVARLSAAVVGEAHCIVVESAEKLEGLGK